MTVARFTGDVRVAGDLFVDGDLPTYPRSRLDQDNLSVYAVDLLAARVHDAPHTTCPGTAANDDLAIVGTTFGTDAPHLSAGDLKAAGATTRYARFQIPLPVEYVAAQSLQLRVVAGLLTTVSDTTATVDVEAHATDREGAVSADLVTTAAQDCNSLTLAEYTFTLTTTGRTAGDMLDVRLALAVNDGSTATAVEAVITALELLADIKG